MGVKRGVESEFKFFGFMVILCFGYMEGVFFRSLFGFFVRVIFFSFFCKFYGLRLVLFCFRR